MGKISQNLSSTSLFHFIRESDWLCEILENKSFQAQYVFEDVPEADFKVAIAMKCFCDIPLGMIKKHMSSYGKFGIGVRKTFAKKNYLTPVVYFHKNSDLYYRYISTLNPEDVFNDFSLLPYFKSESRTTKQPNGKNIVERFYDEREWRFVASKAEIIDCKKFTPEHIDKMLIDVNTQLRDKRDKYLLNFEFSDITYIFVQFEKDIDRIIKLIRNVNTSELEQDRLIAKIITSRQIERDF